MLTDSQISQYVKIPNTPIIDERSNMAREWVYFFNDIGRAVDESIQAQLGEMTKTLLESADTAVLSLQAVPVQITTDISLDSVPVIQQTHVDSGFDDSLDVDPIALATFAAINNDTDYVTYYKNIIDGSVIDNCGEPPQSTDINFLAYYILAKG